MIVKMLRWKTRGFHRLADYIGKDEGREDSFKILHNLRHTSSLREIADQFSEQDIFRKERKRGTVIFHEILSFHERDTEHLDRDVLEALAREYIDIRCPEALVFAMPHRDKAHAHIHLMISGTRFRSAETLRLSNPDFTRVKRQIEDFQRRKFPLLSRSIATTRHKVRNKELLQEIAAERRAIQACYDGARSMEEFFSRVVELGIDQSKYPGDGPRGYDFDIDTTTLRELDERMRQLGNIKMRRSDRDRGSDFEQER